MIFETTPYETTNFYEVLDIAPSASPAEVRAAYLRAKSAYNKDSVALYSLIDSTERDSILRRIEEAYETLSNDHKRREYDAHHGIIENTGILDIPDEEPVARIVSIDRVPPMETISSDEDLLVAPSTDFSSSGEVTPNPAPHSIAETVTSKRPVVDNAAVEIAREILDETQWHGSFLRRVRDAQRLSLEEVSNVTKISKTYIQAIEAEDFKKLPALVFVRGFITQLCRILKLPQDKVLDAYLQRFKAAKGQE